MSRNHKKSLIDMSQCEIGDEDADVGVTYSDASSQLSEIQSVSFTVKMKNSLDKSNHSSQESLNNSATITAPDCSKESTASVPTSRQNSCDNMVAMATDSENIPQAAAPASTGTPPGESNGNKSRRSTPSPRSMSPLVENQEENHEPSEPKSYDLDLGTSAAAISTAQSIPRSDSRSSEADMNGKPAAAKALSMDFETMKVSLILQDDEYDMDDLTIASHRDVPSYHEGSPPSGVSLGESQEGVAFDRSSENGRETGYSGVGFSGRKTPTNGQQSDSSGRLSFESLSPPGGANKSLAVGKGSSDKKKKPYWYNVLSPTYKSRSEDFKRIFRDIPADERLIVDYSCALQKDILVHGRIYITQNWICFYANIFRWETVVMMRCKDITSMTKEKTARVIPNAIQISTKDDRYFFTSFGTRDKTYLMFFRVWQNALTENPMTTQELWQWVHYSYGEELGLGSSDEDYVQPSTEDEQHFHCRVQSEEKMASVMEGVGVEALEEEDSIAEPLLNGDLNHIANDSGVSIVTNNRHGDEPDSHSLPHTPQHMGLAPPDRGLAPPNRGLVPASDNIPTDQGDTTEDEEEEVLCCGHEHQDISVIEEVFHFSVDKLFEMIFTESQLYKHFTEVKKTTELVQSQWSEDIDEQGDRHRTISYTLSLNYSIGPKTSPATEKQTLRACSKPGAFYLIDTECINSSIPYGDNFYVVNRYCMSRVNANKCRLKITSSIKYRKSVWGLVKNFIEKNVTNGITDSFKCLADLLRQESTRLSQQVPTAPPAGKKKVLRRRRNVSDRTQSANHKISDSAHASASHGSSGTPIKIHPQKALKAKKFPRKTPNDILTSLMSPADNPAWFELTGDICKKASKRLKFLEVLKRSGALTEDMITYYVSVVQSVLDYAAPLWHGNLTEEESDRVEKIQQQALEIILPGVPYEKALEDVCLETLKERRRGLYEWYFRRFYDAAEGYKLNLKKELVNDINWDSYDEIGLSDNEGNPEIREIPVENASESEDNHIFTSEQEDNVFSINQRRFSVFETVKSEHRSTFKQSLKSSKSYSMFESVKSTELSRSSLEIDKMPPSEPQAGVSSKSWEDQKLTADVLVRVICAVLVVLAVFNALLFYKLWSLEDKATLIAYNRQDIWKNAQEQPQSQSEWLRLLEQQQSLHDTEIERWRDVLSASIKLLDNMQQSLLALETSINAKYPQSTGTAHDEH